MKPSRNTESSMRARTPGSPRYSSQPACGSRPVRSPAFHSSFRSSVRRSPVATTGPVGLQPGQRVGRAVSVGGPYHLDGRPLCLVRVGHRVEPERGGQRADLEQLLSGARIAAVCARAVVAKPHHRKVVDREGGQGRHGHSSGQSCIANFFDRHRRIRPEHDRKVSAGPTPVGKPTRALRRRAGERGAPVRSRHRSPLITLRW